MNARVTRRKRGTTKITFFLLSLTKYQWFCLLVPTVVALLILYWWTLAAGNAYLVLIPREMANAYDAYCIDGSVPSFYFREGEGNDKKNYIVYLEGGGWCWNVSDCFDRSFTYLGSSNYSPKKLEFNGFLSDNKEINPDFAQWNIAVINYCDGASFSGDREEIVRYKESNLYFRGKRILQLMIDFLLNSGMKNAERIILSGVSAGGLAVFAHADYIQGKLPAGISFAAFPDAGFFPNVANIHNHQHFQESMKELYKLHQISSAALDADCTRSYQDSGDRWRCLFPQYVYQHIQTPMFVLNSVHDYWALWHILKLRCHPQHCGASQLQSLDRYHREFLLVVATATAAAAAGQVNRNAFYLSSCFIHSQGRFDDAFTHITVEGSSVQKAFGDWYFRRGSKLTYYDCNNSFNCNPTCNWDIAFYLKVASRLKLYDF